MTKTLNDNRRDVMGKARDLAQRAQAAPAGVTRADILRLAIEDQLDILIELLRVCPVKYMVVEERPDLIPCGHCDQSLVATRSGARYCSRECKQLASNSRVAEYKAQRRAAAS